MLAHGRLSLSLCQMCLRALPLRMPVLIEVDNKDSCKGLRNPRGVQQLKTSFCCQCSSLNIVLLKGNDRGCHDSDRSFIEH